jgi:hypothetical protein
MSTLLDRTPSSSFVPTSTFASAASTSSTGPTSTGFSSYVTVLGTTAATILACNSIAIVACVSVLVAYVLLYRKHRVLMRRTSLTLSCAMAASELMLHVSPFCPRSLYHSRYGDCAPLPYLQESLCALLASTNCSRPLFVFSRRDIKSFENRPPR